MESQQLEGRHLKKTFTETEIYLGHHKRSKYCTTRLKYRQGKHLTAMKVSLRISFLIPSNSSWRSRLMQVYTVANESQHLMIFGVPKVNLFQELKQRLNRYGDIECFRNMTEEWMQRSNAEPLEPFTEVFSIKYRKPEQARYCKHYMDAREFYGGILHITYAPENETIDELRGKLLKRQFEIKQRLTINQKQEKALNETVNIHFNRNKHRKRAYKT